LAGEALLGSASALCGISYGFLRVLSLKGLLPGSFEQVAPMSFPLPALGHSLPEVHLALPSAAHDLLAA
jgi:hypothetical protein